MLKVEDLPMEYRELLFIREELKEIKRYDLADRIRVLFEFWGLKLEDTNEGTLVRKI